MVARSPLSKSIVTKGRVSFAAAFQRVGLPINRHYIPFRLISHAAPGREPAVRVVVESVTLPEQSPLVD